MERPILFNTEMVKAILEGRKTQTRRIIKPQPTNPRWNNIGWVGWDDGHGYRMKAPCDPGDILWVRETWKQAAIDPAGGGAGLKDIFLYKADEHMNRYGMMIESKWHPSIHMPKEAARIFLRVVNVWVERLNDMSEEDAIMEGFPDSPAGTDSPLERFSVLWDKTMKRDERSLYGWYANPWVWVIEFERCKPQKEG